MKKILKVQYVAAAAAAFIAFLVYLPALQNDFVSWDDDIYIYENPGIRKLDLQFLLRAFSEFHASGNWHPLTIMSHAMDYAVWGLDPMGHHLTSILLHAANTFLVVLLVVRLIEAVLGKQPSSSQGVEWSGNDLTTQQRNFSPSRFTLIAAATTGLLFGVHPIHVESVVWAAERKDVLCAFFYLLSLMTYTSCAVLKGHKSYRTCTTYLLSLVFFVLALLSKPMAVSLPVVLLVLDWYPFGRIRSFRTFRNAFAEKLPFLALSLGFALITIQAQTAGGAIAPLESRPWPMRTFLAAHSLFAYLGKIVFPIRLMPYYPYPGKASLLSVWYILALFLLIVLTAVTFFVLRKRRLWSSAWAYYVVTLFPVIGIVQVGDQAMADRYMYLPSLSPFLIAGLAVAWLWKLINASGQKPLIIKHAPEVLVILLLAFFSFMTVRQTAIWKNSFSLWNYVIEVSDGKIPFAYGNRGLAFARIGQYGNAIEDFSKAISLDPRWHPEFFNNRGLAYSIVGLPDEAIKDYSRALAINANYAKAYCNRGQAYSLIGQYDKALYDFNKAIQLRDNYAAAYLYRGYLQLRTGDRGPAVADFRTACSMDSEEGCRSFHMYTR